MTTTEAIKQLQTEHDLIANERDLDGSQFAPALLEALAMAIEALEAQDMTLYMNLPEVSAEEAVEILKRNSRFELISSAKDINVPSNDVPDTNVGDMISRQAAIDGKISIQRTNGVEMYSDEAVPVEYLKALPSAQHERDIPIKPNATTDKAWGIPKRQAVCPKCDYYLGHVAFLGDYKGKRITYCEVCGQAIDWEGWKFDE